MSSISSNATQVPVSSINVNQNRSRNTSGAFTVPKDQFVFSAPKDSIEISPLGAAYSELIQKLKDPRPVSPEAYHEIAFAKANAEFHASMQSLLQSAGIANGEIPLSDAEAGAQIGMFSGSTNP